MKDHAQKGDKQKSPSQRLHLFNCTFVTVPYPIVLRTIDFFSESLSLLIPCFADVTSFV